MGVDPTTSRSKRHDGHDDDSPTGRRARKADLTGAQRPAGGSDAGDAPMRELSPEDQLRAPLTALVLLAPLSLLGELYRFIGRAPGGSDQQLLADPMFSSLGTLVGMGRPLLPVMVLGLWCLVVHVAGRWPLQLPRPRLLGLVLAWALVWTSVRVALALTCHVVAAAPAHADQIVAQAGLCLAGALQEELLFRAVILGSMVAVGDILEIPRRFGFPVYVLVAAAFFSLAHTGVVNHTPGAEAFSWMAFNERLLAGVVYGMVFLRQGLAVCTLSHALYNIALVVGLSRWV